MAVCGSRQAKGGILTCGISVEHSRMCGHQHTKHRGKLGEVRVSSVDFGMKMGKVESGAKQAQHSTWAGYL